MQFQVLGHLEVGTEEGPLAIGGARTRSVLALLLLNANRAVAADRLADQLWPDLAADRAAANLQVRLSELRRALRSVGEAERLQTRAPGYLLRVAPQEIDVAQFARLASAGRAAMADEQPEAAVRYLDQALALWRGPALADLEDVPFAMAERTRLEEERLGALECRIDGLLACGRHQETVAELEALTASHPLRERFWQQRLVALYRCGRQAEALRAYRELRSILVEQLGIEPSPELRELEAKILRQDDSLASRAPGRAGEPVMPQTRYVASGAVHIAYQVVGQGERDVLFVPGLMSHVELAWEDPGTVAFYRRLASLGRLILFDKRDTGLSDRAPRESPLEERIEDVQAVMNAGGSQRAIVFGYSEGAPMSILFAATYPEKVSALILGSAFARWFPAPGYDCGPGAEAVYAAMRDIALNRWGQGATIDWFLPSRAGSTSTREALARFERMAISPSAYLRMLEVISEIDVRAALPAIRVPTLVIQRQGDRINPPFYGRYIASHIPGARYFEQPGDHVLRFAEGQELDDLFGQIEEFLAAEPPAVDRSRVLTTLLDVRDLGGTEAAQQVGAHRGVVRRAGADRLLATFDAPGQAIRCAVAIRAAAGHGGVRAGVHTGEVELGAGEAVAGASVEIARVIAATARAGEVLVSRTVRDLVVGSGIGFTDSGRRLPTGAGHELPLLAVVS